MDSQKKKWILLAAIIVLFVVFTTPLSHLSFLGNYNGAEFTEQDLLTAEEINDFMVVWPKFLRSEIGATFLSMSLNDSNEIPSQVLRWFTTQGWSAKRFLAVEQRLRKLVEIAYLQNNLASNMELQQKSSGANLRDIIKSQKDRLGAAKYNPKELELVSANLYQISQVLDGKAVIE